MLKLAIGCLWLTMVCASTCVAAWTDPAGDYATLQSEYAAQLDELAGRADAERAPRLAAKIRAWAAPRDPRKLYLIALPESFKEDHSVADPVASAAALSAEFQSAV
jgi:hypothetical protein